MFEQIVYEYESDMTRYENEDMDIEICWPSDLDDREGCVYIYGEYSHNAF